MWYGWVIFYHSSVIIARHLAGQSHLMVSDDNGRESINSVTLVGKYDHQKGVTKNVTIFGLTRNFSNIILRMSTQYLYVHNIFNNLAVYDFVVWRT